MNKTLKNLLSVTAVLDLVLSFFISPILSLFHLPWGKIRSWLLVCPIVVCIFFPLNFIRIRHAVICFAFYGQDVGITCEVTGFSNPSHFSRTFKSMTGLSPREFRRAFMLCSAEANSKIFAEEPILGYRICALEEAINSLKHIGQIALQVLQAE